jgi:uncharacterized protein (TIGR02996 family)
MTDGEALHAAILADPDEDTPRLAYADWLDEQGESDRAEFIRIQVALARRPPGEPDPGRLELVVRETALLLARHAAWLAPLRAAGGPLDHPGTHALFRRGFVEVVWMPGALFRERAEVLFARVPARELRVTVASPAEFGKLMEYPLVGRLAALDLSDRRLGDAAAEGVAWSPFTNRLRALRLRGCGITDDGAYALAAADLDHLRELDVAHNPIGPAGLAALRRRFGPGVRTG